MLKRLRHLLVDVVTYGAGDAVGKLIGFVLLPLYTRHLTPEDYGVLAMLTLATAIFGPLATLGMTNSVFRRFHTTKDPQERQVVLSTGLVSVLISSLALFTACQCLATPLSRALIGSSESVNLLRLVLVTSAVASAGAVPLAILRIDRRVKTSATLNVLKLGISVSVTLWLVVFERMGVLGVVLGALIAELLVTALTFKVTLGSFSWSFSSSTWKKMLAYGIPFVPHRVQGLGLIYFSQYMVRELLGLHEAGLYNIALRIVMPLTLVVGTVQKAWVPIKFQIHAEDSNPSASFRSLVTYYLAGLTYLWVVICVWSPDVVSVMSAPAFHGLASLVPVLALVPFAQGVYFMLGTGFELSENTKPAPLVSLAGLIAVVVSALALVPRFGSLGAAVSTVLGWVVMSSAIYILSQRRFVVRYDWTAIAVLAASSSFCVVCGIILRESTATSRILFASLTSLGYPVIVLLILSRSPFERARIRALASIVKSFKNRVSRHSAKVEP